MENFNFPNGLIKYEIPKELRKSNYIEYYLDSFIRLFLKKYWKKLPDDLKNNIEKITKKEEEIKKAINNIWDENLQKKINKGLSAEEKEEFSTEEKLKLIYDFLKLSGLIDPVKELEIFENDPSFSSKENMSEKKISIIEKKWGDIRDYFEENKQKELKKIAQPFWEYVIIKSGKSLSTPVPVVKLFKKNKDWVAELSVGKDNIMIPLEEKKIEKMLNIKPKEGTENYTIITHLLNLLDEIKTITLDFSPKETQTFYNRPPID